MLMTPEVAAAWLEDFNTHNRPLREAHWRALAQDIREGRWKFTHQGIAIDEHLVLLDGQHRLRAIQEGGKAVPIQITWNLAADTFSVIDTGRRRTAVDASSPPVSSDIMLRLPRVT